MFYFFCRSVTVQDNYLQFSRITPRDAGRYYCSARNVHGNATEVAEVIVNHNEIANYPDQQGRVHEVNEGESISLYCKSPYEQISSNFGEFRVIESKHNTPGQYL